MFTLNAEKRSPGLKAKQLRTKGIIPGVLYGKDLKKSLCLQFSQKEAVQFLRSNSKGSKVELVIDKDKIPALLREVAYQPVNQELEHLSFQTLIAGEVITSTAKIVLLNKEKVTGTIQQSLSEISYRALTSNLVETIEIDLERVKTGDSIRISDLEIAKNPAVEVQNPLDSVIFSVADSHKLNETPEDEAENE